MAVLLVTSSMILMVIPRVVNAVCIITAPHIIESNKIWHSYFHISIRISDTVDGLIYFPMYRPVRMILMKLFRRKPVENTTEDIAMGIIGNIQMEESMNANDNVMAEANRQSIVNRRSNRKLIS